MMTDRYAEHRQVARNLPVDAVALVPGANFARLYNRNFGTNERPILVLIPSEGAPVALVPNLELTAFAHLGFEGEVFDWRDEAGYRGAFAAMAARFPLRSIAVEGQGMRVFVELALREAYPGLHIVDAETEISALRLIKTAAEVAALEAAIATSEAALGETLDAVRAGMTEREIQSRLVRALYAHGAEEQAFGAIVAAAENAAILHAHARDYPLRDGDCLLIDFGARRAGFCADITRTVFVGHVRDEDAAVYETVLRANLEGLNVAAPGVSAHALDDAVIGTLEASPFAAYIRSKTGHGLGREVHEAPYIMRGNPQVLAAGMVFTDEPGLYIEGRMGVRIEDDVLVTEAGCRSLTKFPKSLKVVG